jgi:hypothetical protein
VFGSEGEDLSGGRGAVALYRREIRRYDVVVVVRVVLRVLCGCSWRERLEDGRVMDESAVSVQFDMCTVIDVR